MLALAVSLVLRARVAAAEDATEPIRIEYRAESGCPSADEFNAQVFRRTASARLATGGDTARTFIVRIERRGPSLVGSLVVRQTDGTTESREVAGPECGEVATVLALATALAIDPKASLAPAPELPQREPPVPPFKPPEPGKGERQHAESPPPGEAGPHEGERPWSLLLGPTLENGITPRPTF